MKFPKSKNLVPFLLGLCGCLVYVGDVHSQQQSPADSSELLSKIVSSIEIYETQKDSRSYNVFDIVLSTEHVGRAPILQIEQVVFQSKRGFSIQKIQRRFVEGNIETSNETKLLIRNPDYGASLSVQSERSVLEEVFEGVDNRDNTKFLLSFENMPIRLLLKNPLFQRSALKVVSNLYEIEMPCIDDHELGQEYSSIVFLFKDFSGCWLPISIEGKCLPSNSLASCKTDYSWSSDLPPVLREIAEHRTFRSGSKKTRQTKIQFKEFQDFDKSLCYLSHYGLPEPLLRKVKYGASWWFLPIMVLLVIGIIILKKMKVDK